MDSWLGRLGVRFLRVSPSSSQRFCPIHLVDCLHFFSNPGPRNDHCPALNLFAKRETSWAFDLHSFSLSFDPHQMSLNIDMKMIRPVNFSGVTLNLDSNSWTSWLSCNVVNPGKIFHSNSIGSPSILSKVLYSGELLNHSNLSSHAMFDRGFSFIFPRHNTESENTLTFVRWRLMTCSSPIKDKYFHEEFSQSIVSTPYFSSCSDTIFSDMSNICFIVRSSVFLMECQLSE